MRARRSRIRRVLIWTAIIVTSCLVIGIGVVGWFAMSYFTASIDTRGEVTFDRELAIPALAESRVEDGVRVFDLTMQNGESDLGQGAMTPTGASTAPISRRPSEPSRVSVSGSM